MSINSGTIAVNMVITLCISINHTGKFYVCQLCDMVFNKALKKAEIRKIRIHDLRHYATLRISKGDNIADVSNQLGHFSETFAMKIYLHCLLGEKKAEVDELEDQEFRDENRQNDLHLNAPYVHFGLSENKKGVPALANPLI